MSSAIGISEILTSRASSTAEFIAKSEGVCPNCGERADALRGHVCPGCVQWTHYRCLNRVPIGHRFYAYTCSNCRGKLLGAFEVMQDDRELDVAKAELDTLFERILLEHSRTGSVIGNDAPQFERDVQKYFLCSSEKHSVW